MFSGLFSKRKNKLLWTKLKEVPFPEISNAIPLNDRVFILCLQTYDKESRRNETEGFYKYNTTSDDYFTFINTRIADHGIGLGPFSFDHDNNILYSIDTFDRKLIKYDLKLRTKQVHSFSNFIGPEPLLFFIDRKLHVFGGFNNYYHLILDCNFSSTLTNLTFVENFRLGNRGQVMYAGGIYVKSQNMLLMLGGIGEKRDDPEQFMTYNTIWKYSITTNKWRLFPVKLPHRMTKFACILTLNERYIITLCGQMEDGMSDIFVIDLYEMNVKKSQIKCPFKGQAIAVVMHNKYENHEILITSFCRRIANNNNKNNKNIIPIDIIDILIKYYQCEYIHLFKFHCSVDNHYKINVDYILNSL